MRARSILIMLLAALILWLGAQSLGTTVRAERATWPLTEQYPLHLTSPEAAPNVWAGYRQFAADLTWATALVYYGSSLVGEANYRYLELYLDTINALDRKFKRPYLWGARAVTFQRETATQKEYLLSLKYLERGMAEFRDDYEFFWAAGIRYFLDLYSDDPRVQREYRERGAELIEQAMRKPNAPKELGTFAASLRMKLGQKERALHDLREMILTTDSEKAQRVLIKRYNQLAQTEFPDEARQAKKTFEERWKRELPFTRTASLYVILGDRPSTVIDFDKLATDRDLFGAEGASDGQDVEASDGAPVGNRDTSPH